MLFNYLRSGMLSRMIQHLILVFFLFFSASAQAVVTGSKAPEFTLPGSDGKTYSLKSFQGKTVVLEWLNHGCPFVKKHYRSGNMQKWQQAYTAKGVVWLSIISSAPGKQGYGSAAETEADRKKHKSLATAVLLDPSGKVGKAYKAKTTPHMYVIGPKGHLLYQGAIDDHDSTDRDGLAQSKNFVQHALDEILAGKKVSVAMTPPYGCSVKYKD